MASRKRDRTPLSDIRSATAAFLYSCSTVVSKEIPRLCVLGTVVVGELFGVPNRAPRISELVTESRLLRAPFDCRSVRARRFH